MTAWVVSGPAGAGKTTLGRALAARLGAVLLDLDTATNPLLEAVSSVLAPDGHWNDARRRTLVRPARYAALLALAGDQVAEDVVLVAPFTAELAGGEAWEALVSAVSPRTVRVLWLSAPADVLAARRGARGLERDAVTGATSTSRPAVPHVELDARLPTTDLVAGIASGP